MITNPAAKIYSSINALPEIKNRKEKKIKIIVFIEEK